MLIRDVTYVEQTGILHKKNQQQPTTLISFPGLTQQVFVMKEVFCMSMRDS